MSLYETSFVKTKYLTKIRLPAVHSVTGHWMTNLLNPTLQILEKHSTHTWQTLDKHLTNMWQAFDKHVTDELGLSKLAS